MECASSTLPGDSRRHWQYTVQQMRVHHNDQTSQQAASTRPAEHRSLLNLPSQPTLAALAGIHTPRTVSNEHFSAEKHSIFLTNYITLQS